MQVDVSILAAVAKQAGEAILEVYQREFTVEEKEDRSPLTEADQKANDIILAALEKAYPEIPAISEETKALPFSERTSWKRCWLVDPLDGTKEFIKKNGEFTVNIALVEEGIPVAGVVYQPVTDTLYEGEESIGARKTVGSDSPTPLQGGSHYKTLDTVRVVASRSHMSAETEEFVSGLRREGKEVELTSAGSSLKLCLVAEGKADVYPRFAPTMEWDTAAAHAVAHFAGRKVVHWQTKESLAYNKEDLLNPWFLVE
ncbi:MAG: 3'(2'),5'-bisphosphate nucleotidase CysQ [Verrucomicrobiota bacterium]